MRKDGIHKGKQMTSNISGEPQARAAFAYNAAADFYDASPLSFWNYFGRRTIELLSLTTGAHVLDVCCGAGASSLPAAELVGPRGKVIGVDISQKLLELARKKATGFTNIDFELGDLLALRFSNDSFDAVVCVFGIFFVPDMEMAVRELWRCVRPGGQLAMTTWGPNLFEPANGAFWRSIKKVRPDLHKAFNPWDRINDPKGLEKILNGGGIESPEIIAENRLHRINSAEDWWTIILGSGYRGTIEQLSRSDRERVKEANLAFIRDERISSIETNVLYALATKSRT
jgi:ubiquinone/menaquinone biosynthesis C-methylase UbiE